MEQKLRFGLVLGRLAMHIGSFCKFHYDGLQQAVFITKWLFLGRFGNIIFFFCDFHAIFGYLTEDYQKLIIFILLYFRRCSGMGCISDFLDQLFYRFYLEQDHTFLQGLLTKITNHDQSSFSN